ncbi:MAG: LPS assembly lipoprotein LptE [Verrucomicrobiota bacterium]
MIPVRQLVWLSMLLLLALCMGCSGYRLGPTNGLKAGEKSIQVLPFTNETLEARLSDAVTQSLRRTLQQDGTYRLDTSGNADYVVKGVISQFRRAPLSYQPSDTATVRDYRLAMVAKITLFERATGKVILEKSVVGRSALSVGADLASGEREAIPVLADDLAHNAASVLVDGAW